MLRRLGLRDKLLAGFGIVLALTLIVGYVGWWNTVQFARESSIIYEERLYPSLRLAEVQPGLYELRLGGASSTYASADEATRARTRVNDQRWLKQVDDGMKAEEATTQTSEEQDLTDLARRLNELVAHYKV